MSFPPQGSGGGWSNSGGAARYGVSIAQTPTVSVWNVVDFASQKTDDATKGSVTTGSGWKYTAQDAGNRLVAVSIITDALASASTDWFAVAVFKNGTLLETLGYAYPDQVTQRMSLEGAMVVSMAPSDYIDVRVYPSSPFSFKIDPLSSVSILEQ